MRLFPCLGRLKIAPIKLERPIQMIRGEMAGKSVRHAQLRGELRAEQARSQHPEFGFCAQSGGGVNCRFARHERHELHYVLRKHFCSPVKILAQRALQFRPRARGTAET